MFNRLKRIAACRKKQIKSKQNTAKKAYNFSLMQEIQKAVCRPGIWRNVAQRLVSLSLADPPTGYFSHGDRVTKIT